MKTLLMRAFWIGLLLPLLLWMAIAVYGADLSIENAASAVVFKAYYLALLTVVLFISVDSLRSRRYASGLIAVGAALALAQGVIAYSVRFTGTTASLTRRP